MSKSGLVNLKGLSGITEKLKSDKLIGIIFVVGMIGIALIFLSDLFGGDSKQTTQTTQLSTVSNEDVENQLEKRLTEILSKIEGVGKLEVMVTLESSEEYIFAVEGKQSSDDSEQFESGIKTNSSHQSQAENSYILVDGQSGSKQALVKTIIEPKIRGVLVVCEGGDSLYVEQSILEAVSKLFDISSARIYVTK